MPKEVLPVGSCFLLIVLRSVILHHLSNRPLANPCLTCRRWSVAGLGGPAAMPREAEPPARKGFLFFAAVSLFYIFSCRSAAIAFNPLDTSCLSAKGFRRPFSARKRTLVPGLTCALASTRASGVCASP